MRTFICLVLFGLFSTVQGFCQSDSKKSNKSYVTSGGEIIFSFADVEQIAGNGSSTMRFAPVFNFQAMLNKDMSEKFGLFTGLAIRNVGYITKTYTGPGNNFSYKKKFRTYNLGIPVGIKIGNLSKTFFYGGYEGELAFNYKEKTYDDDDKTDKITGWFSDRNELFQHGFFAGIQFPYSLNLKFKYYLSEFHNRDYSTSGGVKPYEGLKSNIYYFSLSFFLFKNFDLNIDK